MTVSETASTAGTPDDVAPNGDRADRLERLERENERLRGELAARERRAYRRTALAIGGIGVAALAAGVLFEFLREEFIILGGAGLFAGALAWYLTPRSSVSADLAAVGYEAHARTAADLTAALDLSDRRVYVPAGEDGNEVRLYIPAATEYTLPEPAARARLLVAPNDPSSRGVSQVPIGTILYERYRAVRQGPLDDDTGVACRQLLDAVVEQFELAAAAGASVDADRIVVDVDAPRFGPLSRFDHPLVSFLCVGLARATGKRVEPSVPDASRIVLALEADGSD